MNTRAVKFQVIGEGKIHCEGCESRIASALRRMPGVEEVQASATTQQVNVRLDPARTSDDEVRAKLAELGHQTA